MTVTPIRITEIFYSLQGESKTMGIPTVFIRLTGCPLRCHYCDTAYAFSGGTLKGIEEILAEIAGYQARYVTVTGGEPLAQPACHNLLTGLCEAGYRVSLETGGAMDIAAVDQRVCVVLDLKTPGSGEMSRNLYANVDHLKATDQVKFVICDRRDYEWARLKLTELRLIDIVDEVLFSASHEELSSADLAAWVLEDNLPVRLQIQLHKYLWGDKRGV